MKPNLLQRPTQADLVNGFNHIVIRKGYLGGKAALKSRRVSVSQILEALSGGMTYQDLNEFYGLSSEEINEALKYASEVTQEQKCG